MHQFILIVLFLVQLMHTQLNNIIQQDVIVSFNFACMRNKNIAECKFKIHLTGGINSFTEQITPNGYQVFYYSKKIAIFISQTSNMVFSFIPIGNSSVHGITLSNVRVSQMYFPNYLLDSNFCEEGLNNVAIKKLRYWHAHPLDGSFNPISAIQANGEVGPSSGYNTNWNGMANCVASLNSDQRIQLYQAFLLQIQPNPSINVQVSFKYACQSGSTYSDCKMSAYLNDDIILINTQYSQSVVSFTRQYELPPGSYVLKIAGNSYNSSKGAVVGSVSFRTFSIQNSTGVPTKVYSDNKIISADFTNLNQWNLKYCDIPKPSSLSNPYTGLGSIKNSNFNASVIQLSINLGTNRNCRVSASQTVNIS